MHIPLSLDMLLRLLGLHKRLMVLSNAWHSSLFCHESICIWHHIVIIILLMPRRHHHIEVIIVIILVVYFIIYLLLSRFSAGLTLRAITIFESNIRLPMLILFVLLMLLIFHLYLSVRHTIRGVESVSKSVLVLLILLVLASSHLPCNDIPLRFHWAKKLLIFIVLYSQVIHCFHFGLRTLNTVDVWFRLRVRIVSYVTCRRHHASLIKHLWRFKWVYSVCWIFGTRWWTHHFKIRIIGQFVVYT